MSEPVTGPLTELLTEPLVKVEILGLPVDVHRRAVEHQATLTRELALVSAASGTDTQFCRLEALSNHLDGRFSPFTARQEQALAAAVKAGVATIDLTYELPIEVVEAVDTLSVFLDEVDEFCRSGQLLTLITPPEALTYRRWFLGEFARQIGAGASPQPWLPPILGPEARASVVTDRKGADAGPTTVVIEGDLDLVGAVDLRNGLATLLEAGHVNLVLDMTACKFVDSAGLSLLLTTRARCLDNGGWLLATGLSSSVSRSMEIAEVLGLLTDTTGCEDVGPK